MNKNELPSFYILTLFNISFRTTETIKETIKNEQLGNIDTCRSDDYLEYRFHLFEKYTIPSIVNQTDQEFVWLVFFHEETPDKFKSKIKEYSKNIKQFSPIYIKEEEGINYKKIIGDLIRQKQEEGWYITARIDNDDAFRLEYVQEVKEVVRHNKLKSYVINFPYGIVLIEKTGVLWPKRADSGHFVSLLSNLNKDRQEADHVHNYNHSFIGKVFRVRNLGNKNRPMWVEVNHKYNWLNGISQRTKGKKLLKEFSIDFSNYENDTIYLFDTPIQQLGKQIILRSNMLKKILGWYRRG